MADENNSNNQSEGKSAEADPKQNPEGHKPPVQNGEEGNNNQQPVDFSKLSDDQLAKVLEDPRLFKLPRIQELREQAKKAKDLEEQQAKLKEEELKKKGEWEQVAKQKDEQLTQLQEQVKNQTINQAILQEASKQGVTRLDLVNKLIEKDNIAIDENGNVTGIEDAVKGLIETNEFLKGETKSSMGSGSNPPSGNESGQQFTISQIQDPIFYQKNRDAIARAQATGNIIDDRK